MFGKDLVDVVGEEAGHGNVTASRSLSRLSHVRRSSFCSIYLIISSDFILFLRIVVLLQCLCSKSVTV